MERKNKNKTAGNIAIVVGSRGVNATGLIRSLGEAGISVYFASSFGSIHSKWVSGRLKLSGDSEARVAELEDLAASYTEKPVLFPSDDESAFFIDDNCERLKKFFHIPGAGGRLRRLADKRAMSAFAENAGLDVPKSVFVPLTDNADAVGAVDVAEASDMASDDEIVGGLPPFPLIVKPYAAYAGDKGDIRICESAEQYAAALDAFRGAGANGVLVQELVGGEDSFEIGIIGMALPDGKVVIPCTLKKLRSWPEKRGSTTYAKLSPGVLYANADKIERFVASLGYCGLFDIELMVCGEKVYFIEINFRNGQYGYSACAAGYSLAAQWYSAVTTGEAPAPECREIFYMNEREDHHHVKCGNISRREWRKEFSRAVAHGLYQKGDMGPFIRQYLKVPDRVCLWLAALGRRIDSLILREEWQVALRPVGEKEPLLFENGGKDKAFIPVPNTLRYWAADPFLFEDGGRLWLFFEMYDRLRAKGVIGCRSVLPDGSVGPVKIVYESRGHLSFPYVFRRGDDIFMIPESSVEGDVRLLRATDFPTKWERAETLLNGRFCDSVLLEKDGTEYLLTQELGESFAYDTLSVFIKKNGEYSPLCTAALGRRCSRAAGALIKRCGVYIRPAQDCRKTYGGAVVFRRIVSIGTDGCEEEDMARVCAKDIKLCKGRRRFSGVHTYNVCGGMETVDLKRERRFQICNIINLVRRAPRRVLHRSRTRAADMGEN